MKNFVSCVIVIFLLINCKLYSQGTLTATYSSGDIPTNFHPLNFDDGCNGPLTTLQVTLPTGTSYNVSNVMVEYSMTAAASGYKSDQRSAIKFQNAGTQETEVVGIGDMVGTQTYSRNITIANGTYLGGTILKFQMRARRVFEGTPGCNTTINKVDNSSWKITVTYADAGKTGINNTDPQTALDIKGALRVRPTYISVVTNVLSIPNNVTNVIINQGGSGIFNANIDGVSEGHLLFFDNLYGYTGTMPGGADIPLGVSQFIYSDGEWKQNPTPNAGGGPSGGWTLTGNGGTSSPTNYIGTSDNQPLSFKTNNVERLTLSNSKPNLKFKANNFVDSIGISFEHYLEPDLFEFKINSFIDGANSGLNFSTNSSDPFFIQKNLFHINLFGGIGIGTKTPEGRLSIHNRTIGFNFPTISLIDSSENNTGGAILEFANVNRSKTFTLSSGHGSNTDGSDSYLQFSRNGYYLMSLRGDGNLGIGTSPNLSFAPLVVNKKIGNVHAIFGENTTGVSIESAFPGIHFNSYYNATRKTIVTGYTSGMEMDPGSGSMSFYTSPLSTTGGGTASVFSRMLVDRNGNVGINVPVPANKLEVGGTTKSTQFLVNNTLNSTIGVNVDLSAGTSNNGVVSKAATGVFAIGSGTNGVGLYAVSSAVTGYGIYSVSRVKLDNNLEINDSKIRMFRSGVETIEIIPNETTFTGAAINLRNASGITTIKLDADFNDGDGRVITSELQINGGSDLSENFDVVDDEVKPGMIVAINETNEGKLQICNVEKDKKIVGIISGANGIKPGMIMGQKESIADGEYPIALAGRVYVLTTDETEIKAGDFLTSSSKKGYATKVDNLVNCQGAIIGKAMGKRDPLTGMTLVLINLQ